MCSDGDALSRTAGLPVQKMGQLDVLGGGGFCHFLAVSGERLIRLSKRNRTNLRFKVTFSISYLFN